MNGTALHPVLRNLRPEQQRALDVLHTQVKVWQLGGWEIDEKTAKRLMSIAWMVDHEWLVGDTERIAG